VSGPWDGVLAIRRASPLTCRCGHPWKPHRHYRAGTDCSACPKGVCDRFRRRRWWHRKPGIGDDISRDGAPATFTDDDLDRLVAKWRKEERRRG
jgi:hypothetical protein